MSWERDPLWAKARLFFERAFSVARDDPTYGLWCSLGLELLARAALASVSPTLLAKPEHNQKNLLHVVHSESTLLFPKSIAATVVFGLCTRMFPDFSAEDGTLALALLNQRNAELHSGVAAFEEYRTSQWLAGFYRACKSLTIVLGESLESLFGEHEAEFAEKILEENRDDIQKTVFGAIAAHKKLFAEKGPVEQEAAKLEAEELGKTLSVLRHHRVSCPACNSVATVKGRPFGKEHVSHQQSGIIVKQSVSPTEFSCSVCGLKLASFAQLATAGLGDHYTRTTTYSAEEYYGLIDPDELESYFEEQIGGFAEYDNE